MVIDALSEPSIKPSLQRRWLQFGTRGLLAMVALVAVGLALFATPVARQRRAVEYIKLLGGSVGYEVLDDDKWLRPSTGDVDSHAVEWVYLQGTDVNDAELAYMRALPRVKGLYLRETLIGDAGLRHLTGLRELTVLQLSGTQVGDAGLVYLRGLKRLEILLLEDTRVTAAGVAELKRSLPNCEIYH